MLPLFTTEQVKDGIDSGDLMIDLSEYMKKKEGATKVELQELTNVVATKLDAEPQHKHHIDDIKQLQSLLESKFDKGEKYSFNTIISDIEKIPYIENPKDEIDRLTNAINVYAEAGADKIETLAELLDKALELKPEKKYNVITLCGSTKFKDEFEKAKTELTLKGNIVITLGVFNQNDNLELSKESIEMLSDMHKQKIDMSDEIFVINVGGYIGNSTKSEITYAKSKGKKVTYLENN